MCTEESAKTTLSRTGSQDREQCNMVWTSYPVEDGMDVRDGHVDKDVNEDDPA